MAKKSKAASIFWACVSILWEIVFVGIVVFAIFLGDAPVLLVLICIVPIITGGFMIYFLVQRLREIDEESLHEDEYRKY